MVYTTDPAAVTPSTTGPAAGRSPRLSRVVPWAIFAIVFGLNFADHVSRQVLSAAFPVIKEEWSLADSQLASLNSIVALAVGVLVLPLSILADRWGRVRTLILTTLLGAAALLLGGFAGSFGELMVSRLLVGFGEAATGSIGIAIVLGVFGSRVHSALSAAFVSTGPFGAVVGVSLGGVIAVQLGWRWSFFLMAAVGLLLAVLLRTILTERTLARYTISDSSRSDVIGLGDTDRASLRGLVDNPAVHCAYIGGGLQIFTAAVLLIWTPSFFNRYYAMAPDEAGLAAAGIIVLVGAGMILCGFVTDRLSADHARRKWLAAILFCVLSFTFLGLALRLEPGTAQLVLLGLGAFFSAGSTGTAGAMVANLTHASIRASAMGTLTMAINIFGLALGPFLIGILADRIGLLEALRWSPFAYLLALVVFAVGWRVYPAGRAALEGRTHH